MKTLSFSAHEDRATGEWVIRVAYGDSFVSIASANGEEEANLIARSLNVVCSDPASNSEFIEGLWMEYLGPIE